MKLTEKQIIEKIKLLNETRLIQLNNLLCEFLQYEDYIYSMYELDEIFYNCSASEILGKIHYDFNENNNYFRFNGYGLAESFNYFNYNDLPDLLENLAETILENWEDFEFIFE